MKFDQLSAPSVPASWKVYFTGAGLEMNHENLAPQQPLEKHQPHVNRKHRTTDHQRSQHFVNVTFTQHDNGTSHHKWSI